MAFLEVRTVDLSGFARGRADDDEEASNDDVVRRVREACETVGFFYVTNHGVSESLTRDALRTTREFFERPLDEKLKVASLRKGYIPVGGCDNAVRPSALHEKFSCSRVDGVDRTDPYYDPNESEAASLYFGEENRWPENPPEFREVWEGYYRAMEKLVGTLMEIFASALGVPEDFFEARIDRHVTNLVALRYPPIPTQTQETGGSQNEEGRSREDRSGNDIVERVKPHTDPTDVTILAFEDDGPCGLQVLPDGCTDWIDVPRVPGGLLINLGDILRFWTNDAWRSTRHRVIVKEPDGLICDGSPSTARGDRLSIVFFHMPNYDAVIDCADVGESVVGLERPRRYPPFKCGERSHFAQLVRNERGLPDRQTLGEDNSRQD